MTELEQAIGVETLTDVWTRTYLGRDPAVWQHPRFQAVLERLRLDDASLREQGFEVVPPPGVQP